MNKIILITGASSGIGLATTKQLVAQGHTVYAGYHDKEKLSVFEDINCTPLFIEMTDDTTMQAALDQIIEAEGKIEVLINNAGYGHYGPIEEIPLDTAKYLFEVNLFGLARLTQLVLPHMRAQSGGKIINVSSIGGKIYIPMGAWYHASKHAVEGWSDCLRTELAPLGIDVVIVEPGIIDTGFNEKMIGRIADCPSTGAYEDIKQAMLATNGSGDRGSNPDVIADVITKAVQSKHPKTRYHAGKLASLVLFVRRYFTDRFFDKFIMTRINAVIKKQRKAT